MPLYEYGAVDLKHACDYCRNGFEELQAVAAPALTVCPKCRNAIQRVFSTSQVGHSGSGLHDRAKNVGFTTYKKIGKGEYEKKK